MCNPWWSSRPRDASSKWRPVITGYRVNNTLEITSQKLEQAGELIQSVTEAGANKINSIRFGLQNPRQFRSQAIERAVANARADAEVAAKASGVDIKGVQTINLDHTPSVESVEVQAQTRFKAMAADAAPPPVNSGDITVRASVYITFLLDQ